MAGNEYYLQARNNNGTKIKEKYIGKLRYSNYNIFSLKKFIYNYNNNNEFYTKYYKIKERMSEYYNMYSVLDNDIIFKIQNLYNNEKPLTPSENEAYEDIKETLEWINKFTNEHEDIHFVFKTLLD